MQKRGAAFRLRDVEVGYDGRAAALRVARLDIAAGESIAIVGPSGAGKTTLLRTLAAAVPIRIGDVHVDDSSLQSLSGAGLRRLRSRTGFIHQDLRLVPNLRVLQNVLCGGLGTLSLAGSIRALLFPSRTQRRRVFALLERVGIGEKMYERTDRLSGGQQQRVAIARALYQQPKVLLADEPVSSVDPARARHTVELLTALSRDAGMTCCASLHNIDLARELFPRLIGLKNGHVVFDRPSSEVSAEEIDELYRLGAAGGHHDATIV